MHEVVIVGAGVASLGAAWLLARQGVEVTILEREVAGAGASTAAAGMLAPTAEVRWEEEELLAIGRQSMELWPNFVAELEAASGINVDYRTEGTLVVALDRDDLEVINRLNTYHQELKLDVRRLSSEALREMEPGISPTTPGGLFIPGDHQVDTGLLLQALVEAFKRAGGILREGVNVEKIEFKPVGFEVLTSAGPLSCKKLIVAPGAWLRQIDGLSGDDRPHVRPVKGQMLAIGLGEPPLCTHVIRAPDVYLAPKSAGQIVVGATMEEKGFDASMTAGGVFELLRGTWETLPAMYDQPLIDTWCGFRPVSLANFPIVRAGSHPGLFLSAGHGRNGILLTPWTAKTLTALVTSV